MVTSGFYKINYGGKTGAGIGLLALLGGVVSGVDEAGVSEVVLRVAEARRRVKR